MSAAPAAAPRARSRPPRGWSGVELLLVLALAGILLSATAGLSARVLADARTAAAAREFASTFRALRWQSVNENRHVGLFFEQVAGAWQWWEVHDGNGNGLRTAEVRSGVDVRRSGPHRIERKHRGVRLGFPAHAVLPAIPPRRGVLGAGDPVRFGRANLVSFGPDGRSSSGTLFLTDDDHRLYGIRLYGPSTRVRVWRWDDREARWRR